MLTEDGFLQCIRTLQYNGIIIGSINFRVADREIFATINVNTVTVGIDGHIIYSTYLASRNDNGKMTTTINGDVSNGNVPALFQCNCLITRSDATTLHITSLFRILLCESFTIYHTTTSDRYVLLTFCPNQ